MNSTHVHLDKQGAVDAGPESMTKHRLNGKPSSVAKPAAAKEPDHAALRNTITDLTDRHITHHGVGIAHHDLYHQAKQQHPGLGKEHFKKTLRELHDEHRFRLGGWPRMWDDLPDPELVVHVGGTHGPDPNRPAHVAPDQDREGKAMYYLHPSQQHKHSEAFAESSEPTGQAPDQVALPGRDGDKAESLLEHAKTAGIRTLAEVARSALERLVKLKPEKIAAATKLFSKQERQQLAATLAAVNSTANLMGRSRVRIRQERAEQLRGVARFSEHPTNFERFDEVGPIRPMPPEDALAYFRRLVPRIGVDPHQFSADVNREAFTLADATEESLLRKVKSFIGGYLQQGTVLGGHPIEFTPPNDSPDRRLVMVDPAKLDRDWAKDKNDYITPGGGGAETPGKRAGVEEFLKQGDAINASTAGLDENGNLYITDGRHRFSLMRDKGADRVGVWVPGDQANQFKSRYGATPVKKYPAEHLDAILADAGVHPSNPQYSDMVIRTNMKDALNVGADMERQDPDIAETFPCWQYVGIEDGREGSDHRPKFGRYYPNSASFTEVRGKRPYNCRCDQIPIDKWEWAEKLARGARVETSWRDAA